MQPLRRRVGFLPASAIERCGVPCLRLSTLARELHLQDGPTRQPAGLRLGRVQEASSGLEVDRWFVEMLVLWEGEERGGQAGRWAGRLHLQRVCRPLQRDYRGGADAGEIVAIAHKCSRSRVLPRRGHLTDPYEQEPATSSSAGATGSTAEGSDARHRNGVPSPSANGIATTSEDANQRISMRVDNALNSGTSARTLRGMSGLYDQSGCTPRVTTLRSRRPTASHPTGPRVSTPSSC